MGSKMYTTKQACILAHRVAMLRGMEPCAAFALGDPSAAPHIMRAVHFAELEPGGWWWPAERLRVTEAHVELIRCWGENLTDAATRLGVPVEHIQVAMRRRYGRGLLFTRELAQFIAYGDHGITEREWCLLLDCCDKMLRNALKYHGVARKGYQPAVSAEQAETAARSLLPMTYWAKVYGVSVVALRGAIEAHGLKPICGGISREKKIPVELCDWLPLADQARALGVSVKRLKRAKEAQKDGLNSVR